MRRQGTQVQAIRQDCICCIFRGLEVSINSRYDNCRIGRGVGIRYGDRRNEAQEIGARWNSGGRRGRPGQLSELKGCHQTDKRFQQGTVEFQDCLLNIVRW